MLTLHEENYILSHAYVPEHIVGLVTSLSTGEPFLTEDYFFCRNQDWIILIGYPLQDRFDPARFESVLGNIKSKFKPTRISLIAPALPEGLLSNCRERNSDSYYTLDAGNPVICSPVKRNLRKAARRLTVERAVRMGNAHQELMHEFVANAIPPVRVKNLLFKMPQYVGVAPSAFVLNAWCANGELAAFYVIDLAAEEFANYIIGCYSKQHYVGGASDLLMMELINTSKAAGKRYIHLGLGVNQGIRRFKEKWGAKPSRSYEMCELTLKKPLIRDAIRAVIDKALPPR